MRTLDGLTAAPLDLEPQMTPDWNAIRLDLLQVDEPMRAALREMRPFFAKCLPGILARYYDKVRHHDPSSGIFKNGAMQEAIRMQLQHWELIAACNFGPDYLASATRFSRAQSARRGHAAIVCRWPADVHRRPIDEGAR